MHVLLFIAGFVTVALVCFDVFQSIIVPRLTSRSMRIAPFLTAKVLWPGYRYIVRKLPTVLQESFFEMYGPINFVALLMAWFGLLITGFAFMLLAVGDGVKPQLTHLQDAYYFAGTSILTVGFGDVVASQSAAKVVSLSAAMLGLMFLALEVSVLFTLQNYLQMREQVVNTLTSRAGMPASGLVLLLRYRELHIVATLSASFVVWETWVATILESHRAYPLLTFFRSSDRSNSWISSMGAMLDAATLLSTSIKNSSIGEAELFYWLAANTLKGLCNYFELQPTDDLLLTKADFIEGLLLLDAAGFETRDAEEAWALFSNRRSSYMRYLAPIARELVLPMNSWMPKLYSL